MDNPTAWILDSPSPVQTVAVHCRATPGYAKDVLSDLRTAYDGHAYGR